MSLRIATPAAEKLKPSPKTGKLFSQIPLISRLKESINSALKREEEKELVNLEYELNEIASYGFPGVATTTSYDPVQKLLAIGTSVGRVIILGQNGLALRLRLTPDQNIKRVLFLSHLPLVIAVDSLNQVFLIDIANLTVNLIHKSIHQISCIEAFPESKWLFIGTDLGQILVLDFICGFQSQFSIDKLPSQVSFLHMHPRDCQLLLTGCHKGIVYLINLKSGKVVSQFDINTSFQLSTPTSLTSVSWSPNTNVFAAGYENGWIAFWDIKNTTHPSAVRTAAQEVLDIGLELAVPEERNPIRCLRWCQFSGTNTTCLIISGGEAPEGTPHLTVVKFSSSQLGTPSSEFCVSIPFKVGSEINILPSESPWFSGTLDPFALLLVSDSGKIAAFNMEGDSLVLPVLLQWLDCDFEQFKLLSDCSPTLHNSLLAHEASLLDTEKAPHFHLEGGVWQPKQVDNVFYDLALTSHNDGSVRVWDASSNTLSPITHLTFYPNPSPFRPVQALILDFHPSLGLIIIGNDDCSVVIYHFFKESKCSSHSSAPSSHQSVHSNNSHCSDQIGIREDLKDPITDPSPDEVPSTDIRIYTTDLISDESHGSFPYFKLIGHLGKLVALKAHSKFLVASDSEGGLSITILQAKKVLYFERDISIVPAKLMRRLTTQRGSKDKDPSESATEFIVELDIKEISEDVVYVIGISSASNAYLYIINQVEREGDSFFVLSKGRVASELASEGRVLMVSFYNPTRESTDSFKCGEDDNLKELTPLVEEELAPSEEVTCSSASLQGDLPTHHGRNLSLSDKLQAKPKKDKPKKPRSEGDTIKKNIKPSTSEESPETMAVSPLNQDSLSHEEFYVTCFASKVKLYRLRNQKVYREITLDSERGDIMKSKWVRRDEHDILVCLTSLGFVDMYRLPCLRVLYQSEVYMSKAYNSNQCTIANDGRIVVNINGHELRQLCFEKDHPALSSPLNSKICLFDPTRRCPENSFKEVPWYVLPFSSSQPDYIKKLFDKGRPSNLSPIDRTISNHDTEIKKYPRANHCLSNNVRSNKPEARTHAKEVDSNVPHELTPAVPKSSDIENKEPPGLAKMLTQATDMLREREEKLNSMSDKTAATADAAQGFLEEIKAFNERQSKKKWYQL